MKDKLLKLVLQYLYLIEDVQSQLDILTEIIKADEIPDIAKATYKLVRELTWKLYGEISKALQTDFNEVYLEMQ